ncbi:MAG: tyrosine--tRNA ligase [Alphaproteobacteria bacterium]
MDAFKSDFMRTLSERGYIHQCSDPAGIDEQATTGSVVAYVGYDCTAPSLHVGSLVSIMMMRHLQQTGHRPIVLVGSGTTRVGDPSFRDESRPILDEAAIEANKAGIQRAFASFINFDGPNGALLVDNADWLLKLQYLPFLRDVGSHFSVNRMLSFESVKARLERESELSFLEFNYMILQAYDFVELSRRHGCMLQMGGSDQWGNIINGVDLGRRLGTPQLYGLTCPLITTSSGAKMGKTAKGATWLNEEMVSPYEYWQFWRNTEDADVGRFLKLFTELPLDEVARLEALQGAELNDAKKVLADQATALLHGGEASREAAEAARRTFEEGGLAAALPTIEVPAADLANGISAVTLFVQSGLVRSNGEARRSIRGGGLRINGTPVSDEKALVGEQDLTDGVVKLSLGRKKHVLVRPG